MSQASINDTKHLKASQSIDTAQLHSFTDAFTDAVSSAHQPPPHPTSKRMASAYGIISACARSRGHELVQRLIQTLI